MESAVIPIALFPELVFMVPLLVKAELLNCMLVLDAMVSPAPMEIVGLPELLLALTETTAAVFPVFKLRVLRPDPVLTVNETF